MSTDFGRFTTQTGKPENYAQPESIWSKFNANPK